MRSTTLTLALIREDAEGRETVYEVECELSVDPGVRTYPNGDPGYPPSEEFSILAVYGPDGKRIDGFKLTQAEQDSLAERGAEYVRDAEEAEEAAREDAEDARREARRERD